MKKTFDQVTYMSPTIDFLLVESEGVLCSSDSFSGTAGANHFGYTDGGGIDF